MYKVNNLIYGENYESEDLVNLMRYIRDVREVIPDSKIIIVNSNEWNLVKYEPSKEDMELMERFEWVDNPELIKNLVLRGYTYDEIYDMVN